MLLLDTFEKEFRTRFGSDPTIIVRAPGRVNIIGEHTDYNHGFVLPMALERQTLILARPRPDSQIHAYAANLRDEAQADLQAISRDPDHDWIDYLLGVADQLQAAGYSCDCGAELLIAGDIPVGCGLSSSAALEMAALALFEALGDFHLDGPESARLGQRVENQFLGLSSGIMDQFISRCGQQDHALFLDCRSHEYHLVPVSLPDATFVIANTACSRGLTASKYNERVAECNTAVAALMHQLGKTGTHLRDYRLEELETCAEAMSDVVFRRARHVITENDRTQAACQALEAGDAATLGRLMNASGDSLKADYEVTSPELDAMTEAARALPGCYGARMTGAGFGGCTINLVAYDEVTTFSIALLDAYRSATAIQGKIIISRPGEGASRLR